VQSGERANLRAVTAPARILRLGGLVVVCLAVISPGDAQVVSTSATGAPALDAVSIRPSPVTEGPMRMRANPTRVDIIGGSLQQLIGNAFAEPTSLPADRVAGLEAWMRNERFDIQATVAEAGALTPSSTRLAVRALLRDYFHVSVHVAEREADVFFLTRVRRNDAISILKPTTSDCAMSFPPESPNGPIPLPCDALRIRGGPQPQLDASSATMEALAGQLSAIPAIGRPVLDRTGDTARYDFTLKWAAALAPGESKPAEPSPDALPSIVVALEEQLGLQLKPGRAPIEMLVIDHADRPPAN
jgi:uncharacterized protein (TIGR03435 family)